MTPAETQEVRRILYRQTAGGEAEVLADLQNFVRTHRLDINAQDAGGFSLWVAVLDTLLPTLVDYALAEGADVTQPFQGESTILHRAAKALNPYMENHRAENLEKVLKSLLEKGANINAQDEMGITPLLAAVRDQKWHAARFLIEAGANANLSAYPLKVYGYDEYPHGFTPRMAAQHWIDNGIASWGEKMEAPPEAYTVLQLLRARNAAFYTEDPQVLKDMHQKQVRAGMGVILSRAARLRSDE